jgi:hypothetical protein
VKRAPGSENKLDSSGLRYSKFAKAPGVRDIPHQTKPYQAAATSAPQAASANTAATRVMFLLVADRLERQAAEPGAARPKPALPSPPRPIKPPDPVGTRFTDPAIGEARAWHLRGPRQIQCGLGGLAAACASARRGPFFRNEFERICAPLTMDERSPAHVPDGANTRQNAGARDRL